MATSNRKLQDLLGDVDHEKINTWSFYLNLDSWRSFNTKHPLNWNKLRFNDNNKTAIPKVRGIYAFTISLDSSILPEHGYILYMGITGDGSTSHLHKRFSEYLGNLKREDGRPKVLNMLKRWESDLFFSYVPISDKRLSLAKIEKDFLSAIRPPVNIKDFTARISKARRAAF